MDKQKIKELAVKRVSLEFKRKKRGNIAGLAKHLSHKYEEPGFFTKCMQDESIANYPPRIKKRICAMAHKIVVGIWPGAHGGANPHANEPENQHDSG